MIKMKKKTKKITKTTIKQLTNKLIKGGMNEKDAKKLAKKHLSYLNRVYKNESISLKSKIAMTLG